MFWVGVTPCPALEALAKCLNLEYAGDGVTFHLIHPPLTRTQSSAPLPVPPEMMADPETVGRGLARRFVAFAEELAARQGCAALRLDTYEGNIPAASLYTKLGWRYAGSAHFLFQGAIPEVLKCFEKPVPPKK